MEGDALPAVGKVWDTGPKKSLATIMAEASRREAKPASAPPAAAKVPQELQGAWNTLLETVKGTTPRSHPPLASGEPRKDGSVIMVRFTGIWARLAKSLEPQMKEYAAILSEALGETVEVRFEIDESAPPPAPPRPATQPSQPGAPRPAGSNLPPAPPPPRDGIPITPELRAQLEKEPLIRAFLESMSGNIVKVEEKEK